MASHLEISEEHQDVALSYLKFAKFQRSQRLKVVARCFDDLKESRLMEETYTADEVRDILNALCSVLTAEMESELINSAHTNVLLLQQLFKQAEQWHLKLHVDVSELEDGNAIEQVRYFEDSISPSKGETIQSFQTSKSNKLDPLEDNQGPIGLLKKEIEKLKSENEVLRARLKGVEGQASQILKQKSEISEILFVKERELDGIKKSQEEEIDESLELMEDKMNKVKEEMEESLRKSSETQKHLEKGLTLTKQKLLEVQAQLDLAEKELEKKFSQTTAYNNMKKMLVAKNDQIKELRNALAV
ncbi:leucine zipper transcription factor-like protein 1 isoform X2 [Ornithodoros turicata]